MSSEEYEPLNEINCIQTYHHNYVIFDQKGIIESEKFVDDIEGKFTDRDAQIDEWDGYLIMAEQVRLDDIINYHLENENAVYHAISKSGQSQFHGDYKDILDTLKDIDGKKNTYFLFVELDRV